MSKFKKLAVGEILSETQFYKVEKIKGNKAQLGVDGGESIVVDSGYVDSMLTSATQYDTTEKITQTALSELFLANPRIAMSVMFNKKLDPKVLTSNIASIYNDFTIGLTEASFQKMVKSKVVNLRGDERVMTGRHYGNVNIYGRVEFIDMNLPSGSPVRTVDPRTINYLILNNVKYVVK